MNVCIFVSKKSQIKKQLPVFGNGAAVVVVWWI
jgi:hypothetical protein